METPLSLEDQLKDLRLRIANASGSEQERLGQELLKLTEAKIGRGKAPPNAQRPSGKRDSNKFWSPDKSTQAAHISEALDSKE